MCGVTAYDKLPTPPVAIYARRMKFGGNVLLTAECYDDDTFLFTDNILLLTVWGFPPVFNGSGGLMFREAHAYFCILTVPCKVLGHLNFPGYDQPSSSGQIMHKTQEVK